MNQPTTPYPADIMREVADFAELHELDGTILSVNPRGATAAISGYASRVAEFESAVTIAIKWARALGAPKVYAHSGSESSPDYHLNISGTMPSGLPAGFTVLTYGEETAALHDAAITGDLTLDQLARFVRTPEAVTG